MQETLERYGLRQRVGLIAGGALFALTLLLPAPSQMPPLAWKTAALALLMATWWVSEALPVFATALLPIALLPLLGVASIEEATAPYANPVIFLFMGGFFIALAIEEHGLHRRVALWILSKISPEPANVVGGFMLATALISMWVSNSATALMMLPIGRSVVELALSEERDETTRQNFSATMMLGIAYAASIGGLGTLVGTPPNALFAAFVNKTYKVEASFAQWAAIGVPLVLISLPLSWWLMTKFVFALPKRRFQASQDLIESELRSMGKMTKGELLVALVFSLTAALWIFRPLIVSAFPQTKLSDDGVAIFGALLLFLLPIDFKRGEFALSLTQAKKLPFDVLILFGGGLSLAQAIQKSGLSAFASASLSSLSGASVALMVFLVGLVAILATELIGNTALAATMFPIVAPVATAMGENPFLLLLPVALGVSCAFMLPVGTPPNAIAYSSGYVRTDQMARAGLWLNALFAILIALVVLGLAPLVFGVEFGVLPEWAKTSSPSQ